MINLLVEMIHQIQELITTLRIKSLKRKTLNQINNKAKNKKSQIEFLLNRISIKLT